MLKRVEIYTDGGCSGNPGPGGWAFVVITGDGPILKRNGCDKLTTNNRMELTAVIEALGSITAEPGSPLRIVLHTDSQYVKNGITNWIHSWLRNNWRTAAKKPVKNKELWIRLKSLADSFDIEWVWVPGHAGVRYNELCDELVQQAIRECRGSS